MSERISPIHLKQFVGKLIQDDGTRSEVLALIDRHIATTQADKRALVAGLQELLDNPADGRRKALTLVEEFGPLPQVIFSQKQDDKL